MGINIESGTGDGYQAGVNSENRLKVASKMFTEERDINLHNGQCYTSLVTVTPNAGASTETCIMYIKNNNALDITITTVRLSVTTTNVVVSCRLGDSGTPTNTTSLTPVNKNAGSANVADVIAYKGATGAGIGGLSGGSSVYTYVVIAGQESKIYTSNSGIIVPKNKIYTIWASGDCTSLRAAISMMFHAIE